MKLRNRKSYINTLPEGAPPQAGKSRITQWLYFLILIVVVGYLLFLLAQRFFYFSEIGYVEVDKTVLSATHGGRLLSVDVAPGQVVSPGARLAVVEASRDCPAEQDPQLEKLAFEIRTRQAERDVLSQQLGLLDKRGNQLVLHRALELEGGLYSDRVKQQQQREKMTAELTLLNKEIALLSERLTGLRKADSARPLPAECRDELISSPFAGRVYTVEHRSSEYTGRGEPLITLTRHRAPVRIEAYFDSKQYGDLKAGELVEIEFPDGSRKHGRVTRIESSAITQPHRTWHNYKPAQPHVLAYLEPALERDTPFWRQFDRMEVRVRGRR